MPFKVKAQLVALGPLAAAIIAILTTFDVVDWSAAQTTLVTTEAGAVIGLISALVAHLWQATEKEPVAVAATFTAAVAATLALGSGFSWWHLTTDQTGVLVSLVTAVLGVGSALIARSQVTPTKRPAVGGPVGAD